MKKTAHKVLHIIFPALTIAALTIQTFVLLAKTSYFFELFTHYAVYYATAWTALAVIALLKKRFACALLLLTVAGINSAEIAPYFLHVQTQTGTTAEDHQTEMNFSVLSSNFYYQNQNTKALLTLAKKENPTILVIHEASEIWRPLLPEIQKTYPYSYLTQETGVDGILIASRTTGTFTKIPLSTSFGLLFTPENGPEVLAVHPFAPLNAMLAKGRNEQFADLATFAKKLAANNKPLIVIGDFNCTPFSPYFKDLLNSSGLIDTRIGEGILPSWHSGFSPFKIPIDHALVSAELKQKVTFFKTLPAIEGTDHLPIEITID
ncbi:MAG: endonuclease/exonuclease/phosphatase family protein [Candidatus Gracilibacteria bacterium]|jgi:endonuclease/exonuclease/phosphatase (EEP) superfamily protein YafD